MRTIFSMKLETSRSRLWNYFMFIRNQFHTSSRSGQKQKKCSSSAIESNRNLLHDLIKRFNCRK